MSNLDQVMHDINVKFGQEVVVRGTKVIYAEKIPLSSPRINYLSYGGIPIGKGTEFLGTEGGGKTTTALDAVANFQRYAVQEHKNVLKLLQSEYKELDKKDKKIKKDTARMHELQAELDYVKSRGPRKCTYVDAENTLDEDWARTLGVDTESLILIRPQEQTAEQVLQMILEILSTGDVILLVLDSIPMLVSQKLYAEDIHKQAYAGIADAMARFCAKAPTVLRNNKASVIFINQTRENITNPYDKWHTNGGRALKHFYSLRFGFRKGSFLDGNNNELANSAEEPQGNRVGVTVVKTKVCKPDRRIGYYTLNYTSGIDVISDTIDLAVKYGYIVQAAAWYRFLDPDTGEIMLDDQEKEMKYQGKERLLLFLRENTFIFDELYKAVHEKLKETL